MRSVRLAAAALALAWAARAPAVDAVVLLVDAGHGVSVSDAQQLSRAATSALAEITAFSIRPGPSSIPARRCGEDGACWASLLASRNAAYGMAIFAERRGGAMTVQLTWADAGLKRAQQLPIEATFDLRTAITQAVAPLVPAYARRGWGGLLVDAPAGTKVKVDGQRVAVTPMKEPVAVTSGRHDIDALFPSGSAHLQRVEIREGERTALPLAELSFATRGERRSNVPLLATSATLWTAGSLALAGSLLAGALAVSSAHSVRSCVPSSRECSQIGDVLATQQRIDSYNRTANILLGSGAALTASGAALFAWDFFSTPHPGR